MVELVETDDSGFVDIYLWLASTSSTHIRFMLRVVVSHDVTVYAIEADYTRPVRVLFDLWQLWHLRMVIVVVPRSAANNARHELAQEGGAFGPISMIDQHHEYARHVQSNAHHECR